MVEDEVRDVAVRLHSAASDLLGVLRREGDGIGLSAPRLSALSAIVFAGPLSLAALADTRQVRPPTMSRVVDALVEAGLVTREIDPANRRSVRIAATEFGVRLLEAGRERRVRPLLARIEGLTDYERRALARGVEILERVVR